MHSANDSNADKEGENTNIAGPVTAWIVLIFVAFVVKFFASIVSVGASGGSLGVSSALNTISNFILYTPGDIILPLVIGAAIGAEVGIRAKSLRKAEKSGLMNGAYVAVVYTIGIIVIYEVLQTIFPSVTPSFNFLITSWIALPIVICIALSEAFAVLSYSRKVNN